MNTSHLFNTGDGPFGPVVNGTQIVFFEYRPNKAAGYSFVVLFGLLTLAHLIYIFWKRAWFFIPFFLGGTCKVICMSVGFRVLTPRSGNFWLLRPRARIRRARKSRAIHLTKPPYPHCHTISRS